LFRNLIFKFLLQVTLEIIVQIWPDIFIVLSLSSSCSVKSNKDMFITLEAFDIHFPTMRYSVIKCATLCN
jgi:hypothetical protein